MSKIVYICDGMGCEKAREAGGCQNELCEYTTDIEHAVNFRESDGLYWEKRRDSEQGMEYMAKENEPTVVGPRTDEKRLIRWL